MENVRFGSLDSHFLRKSRGKRSFWKASFSSLAENARFGNVKIGGARQRKE